MVTALFFFSAFRPSITAINSMRLLVVAFSPPDSSFFMMAAAQDCRPAAGAGIARAGAIRENIDGSKPVFPRVLHLVVEAQLLEYSRGSLGAHQRIGIGLNQS